MLSALANILAWHVDKQSAVRQSLWLWIGLFLLGALTIGIIVAIGGRRRRAMARADPARPARPIKDAWQEAGKRAEPIPDDSPTSEEDE